MPTITKEEENSIDEDVIIVDDAKETINPQPEYANEVVDTPKKEEKIDPSKIELTDHEQNILDKINDDIGRSFFNSLTKDQKKELIFRYDKKMRNEKNDKINVIKDKTILAFINKAKEIAKDITEPNEFIINFQKMDKKEQIAFIKAALDIPFEKWLYAIRLLKQELTDEEMADDKSFEAEMKKSYFNIVSGVKTIKELLSKLPDEYQDKLSMCGLYISYMIIDNIENIKKYAEKENISQKDITIPKVITNFKDDLNISDHMKFKKASTIASIFV